MTWYRLHYRKGNPVLVEGEDTRDLACGRRAPKVIGWEVATIHTCSTCGAQGPWTEDWSWYGSYNDLDEGRPVEKYCSKACLNPKNRRVDTPGAPWRDNVDTHPSNPERTFAGWKFQQADRVAQRAARTFPMPVFDKSQTGTGWCRWCGEEILYDKGKRKGERHRTRLWHEPCKSIWLQHTDAEVQHWHLLRRDGPWCAICGDKGLHSWKFAGYLNREFGDRGWWESEAAWKAAGSPRGVESLGAYSAIYLSPGEHLEVDHVIPLWKRWDYPEEEHRMLFSLENLWLLCDRHHKAKSKAEAAERAARRKEEIEMLGHNGGPKL